MNFTHTETEAFEGILWSARGPWLTLRDVSAMRATDPPSPPEKIVGHVVIHRSKIAYLQVSA